MMDKDKKYSPPSSLVSVTATSQHQKLECDYDTNPTHLYQAIEAKEWDYAISLFAGGICEGESATWVVRKETNGKLRWRLLPLHAAVIFGPPLKLVERLLADYPAAAQCKDDQGMLPLHLAFRNEGSASWEIIEELLTAYPQAIFVKDRKARTPLECGIQLIGNMSSTVSVGSAPQQSKAFKSVVSVLDLYSQIVVSGERNRAQNESRTQTEARIAKIQETHVQTLTTLKREWNTQQDESKNKLMAMNNDRQTLEDKVKTQEITIDVLRGTEADLQAKLESMATVLNQRGGSLSSVASQDAGANDLLRSMVDDLVSEQKEYHKKFSDLMVKYENMSEERKAIQQLFLKDTDQHGAREEKIIGTFKQWLLEKEKKREQQDDLVDVD